MPQEAQADNPTAGRPRTEYRQLIAFAFLVMMLTAAALPIFFEFYRAAYFKSVSYDDYARYLLWMLGQPEGAVPPSPFAYRIGSVALATPFYFLPLTPLRGEFNSPLILQMSIEYARATQALCIANVTFVWLSALSIGTYARLRLRLSVEWSFIGALLFLMLSRYMGLASVDGIATLPVVLVVIAAAERRTGYFAALTATGAVINEKILLVAFFMVILRTVFDRSNRPANARLAAWSAGLLAIYLLVVATMALPGADNQRDPGSYLAAATSMIGRSLSAKGAYQNLWPAMLLGMMWGVGMMAPRRRRFVAASDIGVVGGLVATAFLLNVNFNVGRIVMHASPLFVIGAAQALASFRLAGHPSPPKRTSDVTSARRPAAASSGSGLSRVDGKGRVLQPADGAQA